MSDTELREGQTVVIQPHELDQKIEVELNAIGMMTEGLRRLDTDGRARVLRYVIDFYGIFWTDHQET